MRVGMPIAGRGQKIGLLGGSFDPPHAGHLHISKAALTRFGLDQVWWLVSPGNPLKTRGPAPLQKRMEACRAMVQHPRIKITDFESRVGTRYTAQTLTALTGHYPLARFIWLMGADNLAGFHKWDRWSEIMGAVPIGVIARPGDRISARFSPAAQKYEAFRLRGRQSQLLPELLAPAWCFINVPMLPISSTEIRAQGNWGEAARDEK
ncbi:MAG: nicotinate-nucleotide adenylyltransferase [Pseudoruegeria sp.]